jgi:hypothetical protein
MLTIALTILLSPSQLPPSAQMRPRATCECCALAPKPLVLTPAPRAPLSPESFHDVHG